MQSNACSLLVSVRSCREGPRASCLEPITLPKKSNWPSQTLAIGEVVTCSGLRPETRTRSKTPQLYTSCFSDNCPPTSYSGGNIANRSSHTQRATNTTALRYYVASAHARPFLANPPPVSQLSAQSVHPPIDAPSTTPTLPLLPLLRQVVILLLPPHSPRHLNNALTSSSSSWRAHHRTPPSTTPSASASFSSSALSPRLIRPTIPTFSTASSAA